MVAGLVVMSSDGSEAYPDNAWIVGSVTDGMNPVENAYVKAMLFMGDGIEINWTLTDSDGNYSMMVPGGLEYVVFVAHGDYYMIMNPVRVDPGETAVSDFMLTPITETANVTISGYVTDEFGSPRSDGHVLGMVANPLGGNVPYYANFTTPDPSGYFEINVIPGSNGGGAAGMDFPGYPMAQNDTGDPFLPGMSYTINIELMPWVYNDDKVVYGFVTDIDTGAPIQSAIVSYESEEGMNRYNNWTMTNETGYYEMGIETGDWDQLTFQRSGYTVKFYWPNFLPGGSVQQDVMLRKTTAVIRGNITDELTGNPIMFCRVFLVDNPNMQENISFATSDTSGYFELDVFEGTDLMFGAEQDGYARNITLINVTSGVDQWRDITLRPYSSWLVGQVTDAMSGTPVQDAMIQLRGPIDENEWTDGSGMYNFSLVPGDYEVEVNYWMGGPGYKTYWDNVTVLDGVEHVLNVALVPWQNALVKGHVYDLITGAPVPGANLWLGGAFWGNWTMTNGTGDYEMYSVDGDYTIYVNAPGYDDYSEDLFFAELSVNVVDVGLMPRNPPTTSLIHGYVNNSDDSTPVLGAEVRIRLEGGSYENSTSTDFTGHYEIYVPSWVVNVRVTAYQHAPDFNQINMTGVSDYAFDVVLDRDEYRPNVTSSLSPVENVSWTNPSLVDIVIEEENMREMALMQFMEWNSTGLDSNWTLIQYQRTMIDPWQPENNLPYSIVDGNYSVSLLWTTMSQGGWLSNGTEQGYFAMSVWTWYTEPAYVLSGSYSNSTTPSISGAGLFNQSSGEFMAFWPNGGMPVIEAPDPTGVFEPTAFVLEFDDGTIAGFNWRSLGAYNISELTFTSTVYVPSGNYIMELYTNDWGGQGNGFLTSLTVDNDPPSADAGSDRSVPENAIVTLDGRASADNVGIALYEWEFLNATGVLTTLYGDVVTYSFEAAGTYDINLTVWDDAGHSSTDSLTVVVFVDAVPIADAGPDQSVDEDTLVTFDGSGSSDDHGIVNYTWTIVELSLELYEEGPLYTFADPGTYHVLLVVTDTVSQLSAPDEVVITVDDLTAPVAEAGPDIVVKDGTNATFDGSGSTDNGEIVDYAWSFFDVMPVELHGLTVEYLFSATGVYVVTLTVTDGGGNSDSDSMNVTVDGTPIADAGPDQTVDEDTVVTFDGSGSWDDDGIDNYTWTIDELSVELYEVSPQYTFSEPGTYHVRLVVTDTIGQTSPPDEMVVTVKDVTSPYADAGPDIFVNFGAEAVLNGSASWDNVGIVDYEWSFFDVMPVELHGMTVNYTFSGFGSYWVWLTVTDEAGNSAMDDMWVNINGPPTAETWGDIWVDAGSWVTFPGWASWDDWDPWWVMSFEWNFVYAGENQTLYDAAPSYQFLLPGEYTVYLTVTDTGGLSDSTSFMVTVVMNPSAWWVDPVGGGKLADGATVATDQIVLAGHIDSDSEVDVITADAMYRVFSDPDGNFEITLNLTQGLNVVNLVTYWDDWGMMVTIVKMINSDTSCMLWLDVPDSPTSGLTAGVSGWTDPGAAVTVNGLPVAVLPDGTFSTTIPLSEGPNAVNITAVDTVGNSNWLEFVIQRDTTPPALAIISPVGGSNVSESNVLVSGSVESGASVTVNGVLAGGGTSWSATVSLVEGANTIVVIATDSVGNTAIRTVAVNYVPPVYVTPEELAALRAELLGEINNLSASMQENVSALQDQIDAAVDEIAALQSSLSENITALQGQIDGAMDDILALQASLAENITALQAQISAAMDEIAALQASIGENVTALQGQIDTAMDEIVGLQASMVENVTALQTDISSAMSDIASLEAALTDNVTALQDQINDAVLDISSLQAALAENVTALGSEIATLEAALQENVTALEQAIAQNNTAQQQALAQNVTALQALIAALRADLQANVTLLTASLADNVTTLEGLVGALDQNLDDVQAELASVNATLVAAQADMDAALDAIQANMTDLQDQIDEIEQATQDVEETAGDTDSFASMLMYLTLILFAIAMVMIVLVWYLANKKFGKGGAGKSDESLEEVEGPTEVEKEFESLEKEIKDEEL